MIYSIQSVIPWDNDSHWTEEIQIDAYNGIDALLKYFSEFGRDPKRQYYPRAVFCGKCGWRKDSGPDKCFGGFIPGVAHACCGHGETDNAYVVGWDNCIPGESCLTGQLCSGYFNYRGEDAIRFFEEFKKEEHGRT